MNYCKQAIEGWYCSREVGHEGPCAAIPIGKEQDPDLWNFFVEFCKLESISLEHFEDWSAWWHCFRMGAWSLEQVKQGKQS